MHEEILRLADRLKETSYRLKEKEEEKDEIGSCLRRRIEELDDLKMKVIALEKQKGEGDEANERLRG